MSVLALASSVAGFVKVRYLLDKAVIDDLIFRTHYRVTTAIFFVCCILVTATNLIGDAINCVTDGAIPDHVINTFCWITTTFTIPTHLGGVVGKQVAHPGIGPITTEDDQIFHSYYQWVPFMLFFQGILFYVPHFLWKNWEEGKIRMITDGIRGTVIGGSNEERLERRRRVVQYIIDTLHTHNMYAFGYFFCEILNFMNVFLNMLIIDKFLGGTFMTYGIKVLEFTRMDQEERTDPMIEIFPRMTKCIFHKYGPSGTLQRHDALCVLALNVLNEKIYIFLWFWLIILAILSTYALLSSFATVIIKPVREIKLGRRFRHGARSDLTGLMRKTQVGDFLVLHFLAQNLSVMCFKELLEDLGGRLNVAKNPNNVPTAPSTMELKPIPYSSQRQRLHKETEA